MARMRVHFSVDSNWFDISDSEIKAMKFDDVDELTEYLQERAIDHIDLCNVFIESDDIEAIAEDCGVGEEDKDDE